MAVHSGENPIYAQLTIAGIILRWPLAVQNRADGEGLVKHAVNTRARVRELARAWREYAVKSPEAKAALDLLLREQRRYRDALQAIGANHSKGWANVVEALNEPPLDATPAWEKCKRWFVELLLKNPSVHRLSDHLGSCLRRQIRCLA